MPDISDVEEALAREAARAIYPDGSERLTPFPVKVFRGYPIKNDLDDDMVAGIVQVAVWSKPDVTRLTTRFIDAWEELPPPPGHLRVAFERSGNAAIVTLSGTPRAGDRVGVRRNGVPVSVPVSDGDTLADVASRLAAAIPGASAFGPALNIPWANDFVARAAHLRTARREVRRTVQGLTVAVFAPDPEKRDLVAALVDGHLGGMDWLPLPDQTAGRLLYVSTAHLDGTSKADIFQRDLDWSVEYALYDTRTFPSVLFGIVNTKDVSSGLEASTTA